MPFEWRVFELAKEPEHPDQNQDAWWLNPESGIAAIADGVTSGIFSRQWAKILTRAVVDDWPDPDHEESFSSWLANLRDGWEKEIDTSGLAWYQRAKLREGGFSTLLWLRLCNNLALKDGTDRSPVEVVAIGDSCLFHIRDNALLESFPLDASGQFDSSPLVLGSVDLRRDSQLQFERVQLEGHAGDLLVLCTDAVAAWAMARYERGEPVRWSDYWYMSAQAWADEVASLRLESTMRVDDATLLLLRLGPTAGLPPEDYDAPALDVSQMSPAQEAPEVDLLAVDDWGLPDTPPQSPSDEITIDEAPVSETPVSEPAVPGDPREDPTVDQSPDSEPDTYALQTTPQAVEPPATPNAPPPAPGGGIAGPPPPPPLSPTEPRQEDWRDQVNSFSERLFKKATEGLSRAADKIQEAKDSAMKKLQEKTDGMLTDDDADKPK